MKLNTHAETHKTHFAIYHCNIFYKNAKEIQFPFYIDSKIKNQKPNASLSFCIRPLMR